MNRFWGMMQFFTRIPIKCNCEFDNEFHKGIIYLPTIGFVLGIIYFGITYISLKIFGVYIGVIVFLLSQVILTGGLHLDGLADTFDGIYSYRDKNKILEIMKDSRIGSNALLAVIFLILFKLGFSFEIIARNVFYPLILMPVFGRLAIVFAAYKNSTPRENGMGNTFINKVKDKELLISICSTIIIIIIAVSINSNYNKFVYIYNIIFIFILFFAVRIYTKYITKIIDGITGDILGCICELSELLYLMFILLGVNTW